MASVQFRKEKGELQYNAGSGWNDVPFVKTAGTHKISGSPVEKWSFDPSNREECRNFIKKLNLADKGARAIAITTNEEQEIFTVNRVGKRGNVSEVKGTSLGRLGKTQDITPPPKPKIPEQQKSAPKPTKQEGQPSKTDPKQQKPDASEEKPKSEEKNTSSPQDKSHSNKPASTPTNSTGKSSKPKKKEKPGGNKTMENVALASGVALLGKGLYDIIKGNKSRSQDKTSDQEESKNKLTFATVATILVGATLGSWALYVKSQRNADSQLKLR
jgi:hypothetical protein